MVCPNCGGGGVWQCWVAAMWVVVLGLCCGGAKIMRERERERERMWGERNNTKIMYRKATVTMHIYTVTVTLMHLCTVLHLLMWIFSGQNVWRERERERERESGEDRMWGERNNIKIMYRRVTATVHIYTVTVTLMHLCTILHLLMWVFFWLKCVK